ncbi:hypothetical protein [Halomarina pelagica]|uniref:hypothetical protein n=1 Tax=Halomarina pelagica TaxID=2961599 RepID=UPI0020C2C5E8|nr:hypothetical protein [Halomarina sp. BND7]
MASESETEVHRIWRCRACGRVRHVDDDGHCTDCQRAVLVTVGDHSVALEEEIAFVKTGLKRTHGRDERYKSAVRERCSRNVTSGWCL